MAGHMQTIGRRLRWIIETHLNVKHVEFAKEIGVTRQLLSRWVNDPDNPPGEESLNKIAKHSGVSKAWIRYGVGNPLDEERKIDPAIAKATLERVFYEIAEALEIDLSAASTGDGREWKLTLGWNPQELTEEGWEEHVHPEDHESVEWALDLAKERGDDATVEWEARVKTQESEKGEYKLVSWQATSRDDKLLVSGHRVPDRDVPKGGVQLLRGSDS